MFDQYQIILKLIGVCLTLQKLTKIKYVFFRPFLTLKPGFKNVFLKAV